MFCKNNGYILITQELPSKSQWGLFFFSAFSFFTN